MGRFQTNRSDGRDRSEGTPKFRKRDYSSKPSRDSKPRRDYSSKPSRDSNPRRDRRRDQIEMHQVTCDKCHKQCEVPFLPTESKPVYCSNCFRKSGDSRGSDSRGSYSRGGDSRGNYSRPNNSERSGDLEMINKKLDRIIKALEL